MDSFKTKIKKSRSLCLQNDFKEFNGKSLLRILRRTVNCRGTIFRTQGRSCPNCPSYNKGLGPGSALETTVLGLYEHLLVDISLAPLNLLPKDKVLHFDNAIYWYHPSHGAAQKQFQ